MTGLALTGAAVLAFFIIWQRKGAGTAAFLAVLFACASPTIDLLTFGQSLVPTATAPAVVSVATFHLALVAGLLALPLQTIRSTPPWFVLFIITLIVLVSVRDLWSSHVASGVLQWWSSVLAWGVGGAVALSARGEGKPTERVIALGGAIIVGWHGAAVLLQLAGLRSVSAIEVGALEVTRASGVAGHSGNLGKIMFVVIMLLLPVTRSADRVARRWAFAAIAAGALLTGLSFSRANTVAVAILIGLWLILGPGIGLAKRLLIPAVALLVAFPIIDLLVLRNEYDPDGGSRPQLLATALRQIGETLWFGVGPNSYLEVVGRYDPLAAGGLPVHSAFLLALAELGLLCIVLLLIPIIGAIAVSARSAAVGVPAVRGYGVVLIGAIPGIVVIAGTGWGMLREQYLILLFFAVGYLIGAQRAVVPPAQEPRTSRQENDVVQYS